MASLEDQQALLLYRVGPVLCCAPSLNVLSIIQPVALTHPPGTDATRPGIFRHSGHVVKTEELRVRFGVDEADRKPGRMIIAEIDSGRTAFWVDDIIDVISMPGEGWGQLPAQLPRGIFSRTLLLNDKIFLYADFEDLQKLQGHGLLKTYIEQLLQEKHTSTTPAPTTKTATDTSTVSSKPLDSIPVESKTATAEKAITEKATTKIETNVTAAPASSTKTGPEKQNHATTHSASTSANKTVTRPTVTIHQMNKPAGKTETTPVKKKADADRIKPDAEKSAVNRATKPLHQQNMGMTYDNTPPTTGTTSTQSGRNKKSITETGSRVPWPALVVVLLLLSGAGLGVYYYLQERNETIAKQFEKPAKTATDVTKLPEPVLPDISSVTAIETATINEHKDVVKPVVIEKTITSTAATTENINADYQAKIEKDNEGITIIIKAPKEEMALNQEIMAPVEPSEPAMQLTETIAKNNPPADPIAEKVVVPKPRREEILHIVVKGDTLWHIAKRYVKNPFRYPELARLSNIKNPDLIYPGNRVRIIREFN